MQYIVDIHPERLVEVQRRPELIQEIAYWRDQQLEKRRKEQKDREKKSPQKNKSEQSERRDEKSERSKKRDEKCERSEKRNEKILVFSINPF